jgi:serine/threonine-protein kinase
MQQIATVPAPDIRSVRAELPEALALVLALSLEKRPELRYNDGEQMARDLDAVLVISLQTEPGAASPGLDLPLDDPGFAQTMRLTPPEAGQNPQPPAAPSPPAPRST